MKISESCRRAARSPLNRRNHENRHRREPRYRGTRGMIELAKQRGLKVFVYEVKSA